MEQRLLVGAAVLVVLVVLIAVVTRSGGDSDAAAAPTSTTAAPAATLSATTAIDQPRLLRRPATPPTGTIAAPDDLAVLVDRERRLPVNWQPIDLVDAAVPFTFDHPDPKRLLRREPAAALTGLFDAAAADLLPLRAVSAFRSEAAQRDLHDAYVAKDGPEAADRYSARPGHSEHQTGLAVDVTSLDGACPAEDCFGSRPEARWLADHAHEHGFVVRYPDGAEAVTGYSYEPWHLRYVGIPLATTLHTQGVTLDEWYGTASR